MTSISDSLMGTLRMIRNFFLFITPPIIVIVFWASYGDLTRQRFERFKKNLFKKDKENLFMKKVESKIEANNEAVLGEESGENAGQIPLTTQ